MKCRLCKREKILEENFCEYHICALRSLKEGFVSWRKGYGIITWNNYLSRISELPNTGVFVKEIAELELKESRRG